MAFPTSIVLRATSGSSPVDLHALSLARPVLVFAYPRTGKPGVPNPPGWDDIPGARGCTPVCPPSIISWFDRLTSLSLPPFFFSKELCSVRDSITSLRQQCPNLAIFGLSTQSTEYQTEVAERLHLPYPLLSDESLELTHAMLLPTFEANGEVLLARLTMLIDHGHVTKIDYPVFPSDQAAKRAQEML